MNQQITEPPPRLRRAMEDWSWDQAGTRRDCEAIDEGHWLWFDREWRRAHGDPKKRSGTKLGRRARARP